MDGINNEARVITKWAYGVKSPATLWTRLRLDLSRAADAVVHAVKRMHELMRGIKQRPLKLYT